MLGGLTDRRQELIEPFQGRGHRTGWQALEDRAGELDLLEADLRRGTAACFGQGHPLRTPVVGVSDAVQKAAIFET